MTRTSTLIVWLSPTRSNSRSCSARSSFICSAVLIVPTSSRKSVPLCACSNRPWRAPDRAGERAAHVAEELGLEQRLGNRAAVDRDEPVGAPRAVVVNRARDHLLAGAGLAGNQDRAVRPRDRLEHLEERLHRPAAAENPAELIPLLELRSQVRVLRLQPPLLERLLQDVHQLVELERLGDEVGRALLDGVDRILHRPVAGDHDPHDPGIARQRRLDHARAVHAGQPQIRDDDVERKLVQELDRFLAALGLRPPRTPARPGARPSGSAALARRPRTAGGGWCSSRTWSGRQHFDTGRDGVTKVRRPVGR